MAALLARGDASLLTATRAATRTLNRIVRLIELDPRHPVAEEIVPFAPRRSGRVDIQRSGGTRCPGRSIGVSRSTWRE